jgi:hypothetical protein
MSSRRQSNFIIEFSEKYENDFYLFFFIFSKMLRPVREAVYNPARIISGFLFVIAFRSSSWYVFDSSTSVSNSLGPFVEKFSTHSEFYSRKTEKITDDALYFLPFLLSFTLYAPISSIACLGWIAYSIVLDHKYDQSGDIGYGFILFATGTILLFLPRSSPKHYADYITPLLFACLFYPLTPLANKTEINRGEIENTTILISIDGINNDVFKEVYPSIYSGDEFYVADYLESTPITKTLPAHWTLATGLDPREHGLLDNTVKDPVLGTFKFTQKNPDKRWWHGTPLWNLRRSLVYDWPGPNTTIPYSYKTLLTDENKIDIVLSSLSKRPELIMTHLNNVDKVGHIHGASSTEYKNSIKKVLQQITHMRDVIDAIDTFGKIRLFVVGDHGITDISRKKIITLKELGIEKSEVKINSKFAISLDSATDETLEKAVGLNCTIYIKKPSDHPRTPLITISADIGWMIESDYGQKGYHGYSNTYRDMRTVFFTNVPGNYTVVRAREVKGLVLGV